MRIKGGRWTREWLHKLRCTPAILLTVEDWTELSNGREAMTFEDFETMIRLQLMPDDVHRRIGTLMIVHQHSPRLDDRSEDKAERMKGPK